METSKFTPATDGCGLTIHQNVQSHLPGLLEPRVPSSISVEEDDSENDEVVKVLQKTTSLHDTRGDERQDSITKISPSESVDVLKVSSLDDSRVGGTTRTSVAASTVNLVSSQDRSAMKSKDTKGDEDSEKNNKQGAREPIASVQVDSNASAVQPDDIQSLSDIETEDRPK